MSGKLDQSLDQIMKDTKPAGGRPRPRRNVGNRRAATKAKAAIKAPTGGIQKSTKATTKVPKGAAPAVAPPMTGEGKIIVSNLPEDVTETQIKDYFGKTIGHIKRVLLQYGPNGRSRGIATITFSEAATAAKAAQQLDGVKVDTRAMKVEVVLGAKHAPVPAPPKGLAERMAQPKSAAKEKEKSGVKKANGTATTNGAAKGKNPRARKAGRGGKPKKKTVEEMDAEMADYFVAGTNAPAPAAATNGGDAGMVDEVM